MAGDQFDGTGPTLATPSGDAPTGLGSGAGPAGHPGHGPDALLGHVLAGRYRIDRRLGSGGMGAVYAGTHLLLDRPIAVKIIKPRLGDDPGIAQRFIQEARTASGIGHPHVVEITDFGETDSGTAYFVMERLDGEDLAATVVRDGPLVWTRVVHIAEQIARALAAAHKCGVVHRDIKPANCFRLTRDDDPDFIKVLDFGLAKVLRGDHDNHALTQTGALLGTPGFIAPELYRGLPADHRVDIYALGALMYKLLTGELPPMRFHADDPSGLGLPGIPLALQAILRQALAEDPAARYATAQALATDLRDLAKGTGISLRPGADPATLASGPLLAVKRHPRGLSFTIGLPLIITLLLGGGIIALLAMRRDPPPQPEPVTQADAPPVALPPLDPLPLDPLPLDPPPAAAAPAAAQPPLPPPPDPELPPVADPGTTGSADPSPSEPELPSVAAADPGTTGSADPPPPAELGQPDAATDGSPLPAGSIAAVQRLLRRRCGGGTTIRLQWKADDAGLLVPRSVRALEPRDDLDASQTCARDELARSAFAWTPGQTYRHTFELDA